MSRLIRQSFLGDESETRLNTAMIGIIGLGGGGSHLVQQFAHIGISKFILVDPDYIDNTNTNRLVGGTLQDVENKEQKTFIAKRLIRGVQPHANVMQIRDKWQNATNSLKFCDLIMGAVDTFIGRDELERFARRHLIPYIDIGMDVHNIGGNGYLISGQVILSTPGNPCLRCCNLITDTKLKLEAERYGSAGDRPQVIWPNGVLASSAVGLAIQMITPWYKNPPRFSYLEYDGNTGTVSISKRVSMLENKACTHHPANETGDPLFDIRVHREQITNNKLEKTDSTLVMQEQGTWWKSIYNNMISFLCRR